MILSFSCIIRLQWNRSWMTLEFSFNKSSLPTKKSIKSQLFLCSGTTKRVVKFYVRLPWIIGQYLFWRERRALIIRMFVAMAINVTYLNKAQLLLCLFYARMSKSFTIFSTAGLPTHSVSRPFGSDPIEISVLFVSKSLIYGCQFYLNTIG